MGLRFHLPRDSGDVPPGVAARFMGLTMEAFSAILPKWILKGFPDADPESGNFDLDAIRLWRRTRYPQLYRDAPRLTAPPRARDANDVMRERLGDSEWAR